VAQRRAHRTIHLPRSVIHLVEQSHSKLGKMNIMWAPQCQLASQGGPSDVSCTSHTQSTKSEEQQQQQLQQG
jgi:hypothetical protein